jgi:hypothetical protein
MQQIFIAVKITENIFSLLEHCSIFFIDISFFHRIFFTLTGEVALTHRIGKREVIEKLAAMKNSSFDRVEGFIECLIARKKLPHSDSYKRRPLLGKKNENE